MATESELIQQMADVKLNDEEKETVANAFVAVDTNNNGFIEQDELVDLFRMCQNPLPAYKIRMMMQEMDINKDNRLSITEVAKLYEKHTENEMAKTFKKAVKTQQGIVAHGGMSQSSAEGTQHSYSEEECLAFTNWIARNLAKDADCKDKVKDLKPESLFNIMEDGVVLCKMINLSQPETIDERTINKTKLNVYKVQENLNLALNSSSAIGCSIVNIGAQDISEGKPHLILGLLWQIIRIGLFAKIELMKNAEIAALLEEGETLEDLMNLSPEELLLRWMNYHLANSPTYQSQAGGKKITNFSGDIKDSVAYVCLLEQIQPVDEETKQYELTPPITADTTAPDNLARAEKMLKSADRLGCREFVTSKDVVKGNAKLNMAFVANLFNTHPALKKVEIDEALIEETREVKTFRNWMNSLGVSPRVYNFNNDLKDGLVLLQLYGHLDDQVVNWNKVNKPPFTMMGGNMKKLENCNYTVDLGKKLKFSLVGIDGSNINQGDNTLTLGLVWQLMRYYTLKILQDISEQDTPAKDKEIIAWTNEKLTANGKETRISSFKDSSVTTSHVVIDLIDCIAPGKVNYDIINPGNSEEEKISNAKYAISMARKIGSKIYALPEDLVEPNPKMVMTVFACLMATAMDNAKNEAPAEEEAQ
ncbi:plastin-2-like [Clavelina lepadiformis]|uniref:plastin-2-like n=1 Tax=Clavelina lepadiformis TaxID=159417 RepID=UPI004041CFDF